MFPTLWARLKPTRRRVVVYLAVMFGVLALRLVLDVWSGYELRSRSDRLAPAYGGRLDAASLSPPPITPGENQARIVSAAAALTDLQREPLRRGQLGFALAGDPPDPAARLAILRRAVAENRLALQVLDEIESRSQANWEIEYGDGHRMRLPSLLAIRDLSNVNAAAGLVAMAEGNAGEAARRARLGIALAGSLAQEPNLLVQLIHLAVGRLPLKLIQDLLVDGDPPAAALEPLAGRLEAAGSQNPVVTGLIGELKVLNGTIAAMEDGDLPWGSQGDRGGFWSRALAWFIRPAVRVAHARILEDIDRVIQYARLMPHEREARKLRLPGDEPQPWWWRQIPPLSLAGLGRAVRSGDEHRAMLVLASTAVALRRCRLEHGRYPEHLDELSPVYLPNAPVDPFTGREPDYARSGAGFTLKVAAPADVPEATRGLLAWQVPR